MGKWKVKLPKFKKEAPAAEAEVTAEQLQTKYSQICAQIGDKAYRCDVLSHEIGVHKQEALKLNQQLAAIREKQRSASTAVEATNG